MLCDKCHHNEASIELTQIVNGETKVINLCISCAAASRFGFLIESEFLNQIMPGFFEGKGDREAEESEKEEKKMYSSIICPSCGTNYAQFVKSSRFGCPDCYRTFGLLMEESIRDIQGSDRHVGRKPKYNCEESEAADREERVTSEPVSNGENLKSETEAKSVPDVEEEMKRKNDCLPVEEKIRILKCKLKEAVDAEDYYQAALYRDEIKAIKGEEK